MAKSYIKKNLTLKEKFINHLLMQGKKSIAERIMRDAFEIIKTTTKKDPEDVFRKAIENVSPILEVKGCRIGGSNFQIPMEVTPKRKISLAFRWIIQAARSRKGSDMSKNLAQELTDASQNQGAAIKKKEDVHRMAEANKAFAHFAKYI